jgi:hypothetical protein
MCTRCAAQARWIAGLALWQFATGLSNVVLGWPLVAAVSHTGGAAALVVVLTWALCESRFATDTPALPTSTHRGCRHEQLRNPDPQAPSRIRQFNALTKPRVIQLIVFCALIGMVLAVPGLPVLGARAAGRCLPGHLAGGGRGRRLQLHR